MPCEPMERLPLPLREGDLAEADSTLAGQYRECAARVKRWVEWELGSTSRPR